MTDTSLDFHTGQTGRWKVVLTGDVDEWLRHVDDETHSQILAAIRVLSEQGPSLGRPLVDTIRSSRYKNMKELRPGSTGRSEVRILFAFDPARRAILLVAGDKRGDWNRWYRRAVPVADRLFDEYSKEMK